MQRARLAAYVAHLALPLGLLLDSAVHWRSYHSMADTALIAVSAAWIAAALVPLFGPGRERFLQRMDNPLLVFYSSVICLAAIELALRIYYPIPKNRQVFLYPPHMTYRRFTDEKDTPGTHGIKFFSVNSLGLRGGAIPGGDPYRIIAVGGSTTECLHLDDSEQWPDVVMRQLNARPGRRPVWIGNAGVSAHTTVHHLALLRTLPVFKQASMVLFLAGINDLQDTLAFEGAPTQSQLEKAAADFLNEKPLLPPQMEAPERGASFRRAALYRLLRFAWMRDSGKSDERAVTGSRYVRMRGRRAAARILPLPAIETGLSEYRQRLGELAAECSARHLRCVFLTQPTLWKEQLAPEEIRTLWFGWIGPMEKPRGYGVPGELARAMDLYNHALIEVCAERSLDCFDLASRIPKNLDSFFDDCHFNVSGSARVARLIAGYLSSLEIPSLSARN